MGFRPGLKGSLEEILEAGKNVLHHQPPVNTADAPVQFCKSSVYTKNLLQASEKPGVAHFGATSLDFLSGSSKSIMLRLVVRIRRRENKPRSHCQSLHSPTEAK